jgi:MoxR-like ATPase
MTEEVGIVKPTRTKETNTKADAVLTMFDQISEDVLASVQAKIDRRVAQKVKKLEEAINQARPIYVKSDQFESRPVTGIQHHNFETLIHIVHAGQPVMLVGPAGTGKSHAAEQAAEVLGLEFYAMSVGAQTSKSDLIGYMDAMKNYVTTPFRKAYEEGGLFLLDEIDAGNSNVLIQLNAALANGYMSFPDQMVRRHDNFRFVASANTFGLGANRQYVGRNQLDAATLDRFVTLQWDIDANVEESLAIGHYGPSWLGVVRMVRDYVEQRELRIVVSPRATQRGAKLLAAGLDFNDVLHMALLSQFQADEKKDLHVKCHTAWREAIANLPTEEDSDNETGASPDTASDITDNNSDSGDGGSSPQIETESGLDSMVLGFVANAEGINQAYELMFGAELFETQVPTDSTQLALTITEMMDDTTRWQTLKVLFDMDNETRLNDKLKIAVAQTLRNLEWDLRPFAKAN